MAEANYKQPPTPSVNSQDNYNWYPVRYRGCSQSLLAMSGEKQLDHQWVRKVQHTIDPLLVGIEPN